jgi:hypothetical protein
MFAKTIAQGADDFKERKDRAENGVYPALHV